MNTITWEKRVVSMLLAVLMVFSVLPVQVFAAADSPIDTSYSRAMEDMEEEYGYRQYDLGATYTKDATTFLLWAPSAYDVKVTVYQAASSAAGNDFKLGTFSLEKRLIGGVWDGTWTLTLIGDWKDLYYTYTVTTAKSTRDIPDPYSYELGPDGTRTRIADISAMTPDGWAFDSRVRFNADNAAVYRLNITDFTAGIFSDNPGKIPSLTESGTTVDGSYFSSPSTGIDYLKQLGVTAVELDGFCSPYSVLTPNTQAATGTNDISGVCHSNVITEARALVRALHKAGISVILRLPSAFNELDNGALEGAVPNYYCRLSVKGERYDGSGYGYEFGTERLMYRHYMITALRNWVENFHIDGFSFEQSALMDAEAFQTFIDSVDSDVAFFADGTCAAENRHPTLTCEGNKFKRATKENTPSSVIFAPVSETSLYSEIAADLGVSADVRNETAVKRTKLAAGLLAASKGVFFINAGDEMGNAGTKIKWENLNTYYDLVSYYRGLIALRKAFPAFAQHGLSFTRDNVLSASGADSAVISGTSAAEWNTAAVLYNAGASRTDIAVSGANAWNVVVSDGFAGVDSFDTVTGSKVSLAGNSLRVLVDSESFSSLGIDSGLATLEVQSIDCDTDQLLAPSLFLLGKAGTNYTLNPLPHNGYMPWKNSTTGGVYSKTENWPIKFHYRKAFDGLEDGETYYAPVSFSIKNVENIDSVTANGTVLTPNAGGKYLLKNAGAQTVTVTDKDGNSATVNVTVVVCEHSGGFDGNGICNDCHQRFEAKVEANGTVEYFRTLADASAAVVGSSGKLTLLCDVTLDDTLYIYNCTADINLNGKTVSGTGAVMIGALKDGTTANADPVLSSNGTVNVPITIASGSVTVADSATFSKDITVRGKLAVDGAAKFDGTVILQSGGSLTLKNGTYKRITSDAAVPYRSMLAPGYLFATESGTYLDSNITVTETAETLTVLECPHPNDKIGDDGKCKLCSAQMAVKADDRFFASYESAVKYANTRSSCTITLLDDVIAPDDFDGDACITGNVTLDLNGKSINCIIVGRLTLDENYNPIRLVPGTLTVKGISGSKAEEIDVLGSTLTVSGGDIGSVYLSEDGASITVTGGTIEILEADDETASVTVSGGFVESLSTSGKASITGGTVDTVNISGTLSVSGGTGHGGENNFSGWYISDGSVTVTDGEFGKVRFLFTNNGKLTLNGGTFAGISTDKTGSSEYRSVFLSELLGKDRAFYDKDGKVVNVSDKKTLENVSVKAHEHMFRRSKCSICGYTCDHSGDDHSKPASYFRVATCSVCSSQYGSVLSDTTPPTLTISGSVGQKALTDPVTFDKTFSKGFSVTAEASDDSYTQEGFDHDRHYTDIHYYISSKALTVQEVEALSFSGITATRWFGIGGDRYTLDSLPDGQYVVYFCAVDHSGNKTYAVSEGFVLDQNFPTVMIDAPFIRTLSGEEELSFCGVKEIVFEVLDDNLSQVTVTDPSALTVNESGIYTLKNNGTTQVLTATDATGNTTRITFRFYDKHDFDPTTDQCTRCGEKALAKITSDAPTLWYTDAASLARDVNNTTYAGATLTLVQDVSSSTFVFSGALTVDLSGKTLTADVISVDDGTDVTILSSGGEGTLAANVTLNNDGDFLTMGEGLGDVTGVTVYAGHLTVKSGRYGNLTSMNDSDEDTRIHLCGGSYTLLSACGSARALLGKGFRFDGISYADAADSTMHNVTVVSCDHVDMSESHICSDCGYTAVAGVTTVDAARVFDTIDDAILYAEANDGCTIRLYRDAMIGDSSALSDKEGCAHLTKGNYTIDLAGKTLFLDGESSFFSGIRVEENCRLTVSDSVGGGKIKSRLGTEVLTVASGGTLIVTGGDFTELCMLEATDRGKLTLSGGKFNRIRSIKYYFGDAAALMSFLDDGYAFMIGSRYANDGDVKISQNPSCQWIADVTVVPVPLTVETEPTDITFYKTTPDGERPTLQTTVFFVGSLSSGNLTFTLEKADGTAVEKKDIAPSAGGQKVEFSVSDAGEYRIKIEFNGYVCYTKTVTVTVSECTHPGITGENKCTQCRCDIAATVTRGTVTTGYADIADALAAAQTQNGCTLKLLADVDKTLLVRSGSFTIDAVGRTFGGNFNVQKGVVLTVEAAGTVFGGKIVCAKGAQLTVNGGTVKSAVNAVGTANFTDTTFESTVSGHSEMTLTKCVLKGNLSASGIVRVETCTLSADATALKDGELHLSGGSYCSITANTDSKLFIYSGSYTGTVKAVAGSNVTVYNGGIYDLLAESGSKLTIENGLFTTMLIQANADATLTGGYFSNITVVGKRLMDCLGEGCAFVEDSTGTVIDGRVGIAGGVHIISDHTHECVWKTSTHEKLCGCGFVEETDLDAPVFHGIADGDIYGDTTFTVSDDNDFTVTLDGKPFEPTLGKYRLIADNQPHTLVAADIAGNVRTLTVTAWKLYRVTLPSGTGYTVIGEATAGHGTDYTFEVKISEGYSKTENYKVLVNGILKNSDNGCYTVRADGDITVEVLGVADITAPDAEIEINENRFNSFMNSVTFGLFFKRTLNVTVTASDKGSGLQTAEYLLSETAFADADSVIGSWTALTVKDGKASFTIEPDKKAFVYVRVTDQSGNMRIINSDGVVVYTDSGKITESVTVTLGNSAEFEAAAGYNTARGLFVGTTPVLPAQYTVSGQKIRLSAALIDSLGAGDFTVRVLFNPLGEEYVERTGNEAPAEVTVKLVIEKKTAAIDAEGVTVSYNGSPLGSLTYTTDSDGAVTAEYKPTGADDSAYTTEAPKNAGSYTVRFTTAETAIYYAASTTVTCEILPKEVRIVGTKVQTSRTYDGTTDAAITNVGTLSENFDGKNLTIVQGMAAYADKNVGTDKTVSFSGFALAGSAAGNYTLVAQPTAVKADITPREVTINGTTVETTRAYDGTADAVITNIGTLSENFDGENLTIVKGTAFYNSKHIGINKTVSFADFALAGSAAGNYTLVAQPTAVKADITPRGITINGVTVEAAKTYDGTSDAVITNAGTPSENFDGENLTIGKGTATYADKNVGTDKTVYLSGFALTGSAAGNYMMIDQPTAVKADITPKEVTINGTAAEATKIYDGTIDAVITNIGTLSENFDGKNLTIVEGTAAYADKNVGTGKTVSFSGFALEGSAAGNYTLTAQPAAVKADITPKELTVGNLKIKTKSFDGTNRAEFDGTPTLEGVLDGDTVSLIPGTPTFDRVEIGSNLPISFTEFALFGDPVTIGNYTLRQPSGITASITEYVPDGSEYTADSADWICTDFTVTANGDWLVGLTADPNGEWSHRLTRSEETSDGKLTFYLKNSANGAISTAVTVKYKIDKTVPTAEVTLNERSQFQTVLNRISFGLFYNEEVRVKLTAKDEASGIRSIGYYKSDCVLTEADVRAITDWTEKDSLNIAAKDKDRFIVYVRVEDNAGNVTYIGSDGAIFDTAAPEISGVENENTYYVTRRVQVTDDNLKTVTVNGTEVGSSFLLAGDLDITYTVKATDKAGNEIEYTIIMKPIASLSQAIAAITEENVKADDAQAILDAEAKLLAVKDAFDKNESTTEEWQRLLAALENCKNLSARIERTAKEMARLTEAVGAYRTETVKSTDKAALETLKADIDALLDGDNLTAAQRQTAENLKAAVQALLDRISAAKDAAEKAEIIAVKDITADNVRREDKDALLLAKDALEKALEEFDGNYTDDERQTLETRLDKVKKALAAIENVEIVLAEIDKLPDVRNVRLSDKDTVLRVKKDIDSLTDHEKEMLGKDAIKKVNALIEQLEKLYLTFDDPRIIEGENQEWVIDSDKNARFVSNADFDEFMEVLVDDRTLDPKHYIVSEGSTVVELKVSYLKTLALGEHTLSIISRSGRADTVFTIVKEPGKKPPQTGDNGNPALWLVLMIISGGALAGAAISEKRRRSGK